MDNLNLKGSTFSDTPCRNESCLLFDSNLFFVFFSQTRSGKTLRSPLQKMINGKKYKVNDSKFYSFYLVVLGSFYRLSFLRVKCNSNNRLLDKLSHYLLFELHSTLRKLNTATGQCWCLFMVTDLLKKLLRDITDQKLLKIFIFN